MIRDEHIELIQADVDGELPADRRAELAALLLADPEARRLREQLASLASDLARVSPVEPPSGLVDGVMAALPPTKGTALRGSGGTAPTMLFRYAAVVAGALLAATIALRFGTDGGVAPDPSQLAGTLAPAGSMAGRVPVDEATAAVGQGTATAQLFVSGAGRVVEIELPAGAGVDALTVEEAGRATTTDLVAVQKNSAGHYALALEGPGKPGELVEIVFVRAGIPVQRVALEVPVER